MNSYTLSDKHGMLSRDEIDLIKKCVLLLPADNPKIVNIGANVGTSVCAMLEANSNCFIFSVDKHPCPEERNNLIACGLPANKVIRILGDSTKIDMLWPCPVDLVFIDGDHGNEAVKQDTQNWKIHTRHIMIFHDVNHPNLPELTPLVDKLMSDWDKIGTARYLVAYQRKPSSVVYTNKKDHA
jgi:precorrin-6B methylase 2